MALMALTAAALPAQDFELVLAGGRIVDGQGNPWYRADIGIRQGRIAEFGKLSGRKASRVIDVHGQVVSPGFIDMMGTSSLPLLVNRNSAESKLRQGITTLLAGEGDSDAPQNDRLLAAAAATAGYRWHAFGEYFRLLEQKGIPMNVIHNVGAAQVRRVIIGDEDRAPMPKRMDEMKELMAQAMRVGAVGLSSALIYPPGTYAKTEDAAYGINTEFRDGLTELELQYVVGVQSSMTVWEPGKQPLPANPRGRMGRPPRLLHRTPEHRPFTVKQLAMALPTSAFKEVTWREGTDRKLRSRFAAVRVRPAHRDYWKAGPHPEEWLLIEWPGGEEEPTKYWISTLPSTTKLKALIKMAKHRWIIERDDEELKQELGLGRFECRNWRGFRHHATLCIAAYGFLVAERNRFSPPPAPGILDSLPPGRRPTSARGTRRVRPERHNPNSITTLRINLARWLTQQLPRCPYCGSSPR